MVRAWQDALLRCVQQAIEMGHLRAGYRCRSRWSIEMYGLVLALHHDARFLKMPGSTERAQIGFERLLESYRNPLPAAGPGKRPSRPESAAK